MKESILKLQGISKYYYTDTNVTQALRKINLEFSMGEFVAITGESGGGKSTLLNIISGLDTFDEGEMFFREQPTFQFDEADWEEYRRNQIGFVFQDYSLIDHYTSLDNIVAALVIQEQEEEQAKKLAMKYLVKVGLKDFAGQKASQLSSGQKQRLSIARALAKNTDIIVADEPTGNLDSETGEQIIQLLEELSKDKLVIMVTHNYEQAQSYVTRKIRLHDGEVITDIPVKEKIQKKQKENSEEKEVIEKKIKIQVENKPHGIASFFAKKNLKNQKGRTALLFSVFLITAVISFLFIGEILFYADDRVAKKYDSKAYLQKNDTRLVVRYPDDRPLTEEDQKKIASVKQVEEIDLYGFCNDVNYFYREGEEYERYYDEKEESIEVTETMEEKIVINEVEGVTLKDKSNFMRSASCLSKSDLAKGRLPESRNEIVIYSQNEDVLDTKSVCYFTANNMWNDEEMYHTELTVVGLLKEETEQVYFDYRLCQMLTTALDGKVYKMDYFWDWKAMAFMGELIFIPIISDDLKENEVRVSGNYKIPSTGYGKLPKTIEEAFQNTEGNGMGLFHVGERTKSKEEEMEEILDSQYGSTDARWDDEKAVEIVENVKIYPDLGEVLYEVDIVPGFSNQGADFLEVSEEMFQKLYGRKTTQASVYISNYSETERVISELSEMGYDVISTYQVSTTEYIPEKVVLRLQVLGISAVVLLVLVFLQIIIVRSFMKIKIKDYYILKFMGMKIREMKRISYFELGTHCIFSVIITLIAMIVLNLLKVPFIVEIMPYYKVSAILYYVLYNIGLMILTVFFFNRLLKKKV